MLWCAYYKSISKYCNEKCFLMKAMNRCYIYFLRYHHCMYMFHVYNNHHGTAFSILYIFICYVFPTVVMVISALLLWRLIHHNDCRIQPATIQLRQLRFRYLILYFPYFSFFIYQCFLFQVIYMWGGGVILLQQIFVGNIHNALIFGCMVIVLLCVQVHYIELQQLTFCIHYEYNSYPFYCCIRPPPFKIGF